VGELNLLSMVFMLALIGIGMDYLVQVLTRYREQAARRSTPMTIWTAVFRQVAAPINTACAGAAGAFLVATFTDFSGAAHLGIIAGGGLLLCLLAGYVVLPPLLTIFPAKPPKNGRDLGPLAIVTRRILLLPVAWIALLLAGGPFALKTGFDPSLIELQAPNLESVRLVNKLETWSYAILSKDLTALRRAHDVLRDSQLVERTESVLSVYDNYDWLKAHEKELPAIEWAEPEAVDADDLSGLSSKVEKLADNFKTFADAATPLRGFAKLLEQNAKGDAASKAASRLTEWQKQFIEQLKLAVEPFHPTPPDLSKLPRELTGHFVAEDGTYALYAYPKEDLWHRDAMARFVHDVEARTKDLAGDVIVTGIVPNVFYTTNSIAQSFYKSTVYALALIFVLVLIDLRSVRQTLLAISVLAFGLPMMVAINGLVGVNWNFANFFGLPILIGAGHEYGVFLVHRYREAVRDPRRAWRRWDVADKGLLLCAYVTCTSFGFFAFIAHHRGLRSLGLVMAVGTACIYLAAILVLRPVLLWRLSKRAQGDPPKTTPPPEEVKASPSP
jgi:predicted RND superfamily exporter protein